MPTNIIDLMSGVYDMLQKQLGAPAAGTFLQMGWPGISLSPADFKPSANPNGPYDAATAEETVSLLANIAPTANAVKFENSGYEIDDLYQILITGAIPTGIDPANVLNAPQYKLFSDAQYEFVSSQHGSTRDPSRFYNPCRATPIDWYSEEAAKSWPVLAINSGQVKPAKQDAPFVMMGGRQLVDAGILKVAPKENKAAVQAKLQAGVDQRVARYEARIPPAALINTRPLDLARLQNVTAAPAMKRAGVAGVAAVNPAATFSAASTLAKVNVARPNIAFTIDSHAFKSIAAANATPAAKAALRPSYVVARAGMQRVDIDTKRFDIVASKEVPFGQRLYLRHVLAEQLVPAKVMSTTEGFNISFRYCLVNIDRSWLKSALLNLHTWYMLGMKAGEYSAGKIDNNPGMFPLLPHAFMAIRDLKISASWSQEDAATITQSKAFGPFDIRSGTFNQSTLEAKGLQIIAWVSRLTPALPPLPDPTLK